MIRIAWRMLIHKPMRLLVTWGGLGTLFFLAAVQIGLLVGWCNTVSAIIRHTNADVWIMAEKTLAFLRERNMPTIYISNPRMQTQSEAASTAQKYGAAYFGGYAQGIPVDHEHWQFDNDKSFGGTGKGAGGHLTAAGCLMVAQRMAPLVEKVLQEKGGVAAPAQR